MAAAALLDRVAPALHPRIRSWILLEAGGNPLGLLELSDEAKRRGSAAMSGTSMPLPARLEQTYAGLVSELPDATRALLLTAAFNDSHSLQETLDAAAAAFGRRIMLDELERRRSRLAWCLSRMGSSSGSVTHWCVRPYDSSQPSPTAAGRTRLSRTSSGMIRSAVSGIGPQRPSAKTTNWLASWRRRHAEHASEATSRQRSQRWNVRPS